MRVVCREGGEGGAHRGAGSWSEFYGRRTRVEVA